jgi:glycosyltransferase involved in cell wall biosynthesis
VTIDHSTPLLATTGGLMLGGSTTFLLNLGRAFRERGLSLPIVPLADENEMAADFAKAGIAVSQPPDTKMIFEDRLRQVYSEIAAKKPAAVLACLGGDSFEVLRMLPKGVVRIGIIQSDDPGPYKLIRQFAPWLDAVVGVSEAICRKLSQEPLATKMRIEQIPYGIHFGPAQVLQQHDGSKPLRLVYVGRIIEEQKRVSRLVALAKTLAARGEKFEFKLVGNGPELQSCRDALGSLTNVQLLGDVPNHEIKNILRASDVFVLLSDYEGLPLSLLEAMGEGVVPVVSDLESGMRQVVTPETGVRVPIGNVEAAADAIGALARDATRLNAMANAASEFVRREYSSATMAEKYLKLIGDLAKTEVVWPGNVSVPVPLSYGNGWLAQSWSRPMRRLLKRVFR